MISHTLALYSLVLEDTRTRAVAVAGGKLEDGVVQESTSTEHRPQSTQSTEHSTAAEESTELKSEHSAQARGRG